MTDNNANNNQTNNVPKISQLTYGFFRNQTQEFLYKNYFKNKNDIKKQTCRSKSNTKTPNNVNINNTNQSKKIKEDNKNYIKQRKKELLEEIIKANAEVIKKNPFLNINPEQFKFDDNINKFSNKNLLSENATTVNIKNEMEIKRQKVERIHEELIHGHLPTILGNIEMLIGTENKRNDDFYFVKNKYKDIINDYKSEELDIKE